MFIKKSSIHLFALFSIVFSFFVGERISKLIFSINYHPLAIFMIVNLLVIVMSFFWMWHSQKRANEFQCYLSFLVMGFNILGLFFNFIKNELFLELAFSSSSLFFFIILILSFGCFFFSTKIIDSSELNQESSRNRFFKTDLLSWNDKFRIKSVKKLREPNDEIAQSVFSELLSLLNSLQNSSEYLSLEQFSNKILLTFSAAGFGREFTSLNQKYFTLLSYTISQPVLAAWIDEKNTFFMRKVHDKSTFILGLAYLYRDKNCSVFKKQYLLEFSLI